MTDNRRDASIVAMMGATGSGKSTAVRLALDARPPARLLVWDLKGEYLHYGDECSSERVLYARVSASWSGSFRCVFRPSFDVNEGRRQFDWFCQLAYALARVHVVADELHRVMLPNWSPAGWNQLVSMGRSRGVSIIAASQRPAGIEKSFWDQATVIRSGRLNGAASSRAIADVLMVPWQEVVALPPLAWIQRSIYEPVIVRGRIEWRSGRPVNVIESKKNLPTPGSI